MSDVKPQLILREKWLSALESGKYKQCYRVLHSPLGEFCALGVAGKLIEKDGFPRYDEIYKAYGFKDDGVNAIFTMNDSQRHTLSHIAKIIRENPSLFFED